MTKDRLIAYLVEKARISTQRAELAYDAFWEAIIAELKTGSFSLPYGAGTVVLREKPYVPGEKPVEKKGKAAEAKSTASKKVAKKPEPAKKAPAKKAPAQKAPVKKGPTKKPVAAKKKAKKK